MEKLTQDQYLEEKYLSFKLSGENYAIPLLYVKEVIALVKTTAIPGSPNYYKGVFNLRGQIVPIIDLRLRMKFSKAETTPETSVIILNLNEEPCGVIVDSVENVLSILDKDVSQAPNVDNAKSTQVNGVYKSNDHLILLLDIFNTLNIKEIKNITATAAAA